MPSKVTTLFSKHRRSTPTKQCVPHNFSKPLSPLPISASSAPQKLPCGCFRAQVMPHQDTDITDSSPGEFTVSISQPTPKHISRWSTSTTDSWDWPYTGKFHYYLPHISSEEQDFYTSQEDVAYDIPSSPIQGSAAPAPPTPKEEMELSFINEDDFPYYPSSEKNSEVEEKPIIGEKSKKTKLVKKKE